MKWDRKDKRYLKILAAVILALQFGSAAYADTAAVPDSSHGKNPGVIQASNGTTVVNIRTPNSSGLSHNQYTNLQVGKDGLIFNNSGQMSKTQLAGYIMGNQNLAGNMGAKVILNEVTGTNRTALNGYMEVAGKQADVVITNPNGISGNNFGFINTSRAVLTTGVPQITSDGRLGGFLVSQGTVSINGQGMDTSTVPKTDILARAVQVNAGIWAKDLNVVTGSNQIDYATGNVTKVLSNEDKGVSLDVAAKGVGVNEEGVVRADSGDVTVTQEGSVLLKNKLGASNDVTVSSQDAVENDGTLQAANHVQVTGAADITNTGTISGTSTSLSAADVTNTDPGTIYGDTLTVQVQGNVNNTGTLNGKTTAVTADTLNNTDTGRIYGDTITVKKQYAEQHSGDECAGHCSQRQHGHHGRGYAQQ